MYTDSDLERIFNLRSNLAEEYPELSDISEILRIIFFRTAFFSTHIDNRTSRNSINYIINLFSSIEKEDLKLIDHHLIDTFTYPYSLQNEELINGLNSIFRPKEMNDDNTYVLSFAKIFMRLCAINAAGVDITKYNNLDVLVKTFSNFMITSPVKRDYYALLQLVMAYIYKNIDKINENTILYILYSLFKDDYYLATIRLNSALRLDEIIDDKTICSYNKEALNYTYQYVSIIVEKILSDQELASIKRVIM